MTHGSAWSRAAGTPGPACWSWPARWPCWCASRPAAATRCGGARPARSSGSWTACWATPGAPRDRLLAGAAGALAAGLVRVYGPDVQRHLRQARRAVHGRAREPLALLRPAGCAGGGRAGAAGAAPSGRVGAALVAGARADLAGAGRRAGGHAYRRGRRRCDFVPHRHRRHSHHLRLALGLS